MSKQAPAINAFYSQPILNSPYEEPRRHWEMDKDHQPTKKILDYRRPADFITPIPQPKKRRKPVQGELMVDDLLERISDEKQEYHKALINEVRRHVSEWRKLPKARWRVTPTTARLLEYWRTHKFNAIRPFFCQIEAVETAIWLTEVAPQNREKYGKYLDHLDDAAQKHNSGLPRLAFKMATGSGKTTVMAMLIAWQTLNAVRGRSARYSNGFLIVAPGITIRDRLQLLKPNYPGNYYSERELVPPDLLGDMRKAAVVITNYHAFMLREKLEISRITRGVVEGWANRALASRETPGEMIQRVMPELARMQNIIVINDEAHHCYQENPQDDSGEEFGALKGQDKTDAKNEAAERREAARVWINGLETVQKQLGLTRVYDLSATPFFLAGSGYAEGTIFPWTMSDFSLMDAIECGIVKLPRIPVADNIPELEVPMYRNLWEHIRAKMPRKNSRYDPQALPSPLLTALEALYGHYKKTFEHWQNKGISIPPCFIIVCNNTAASKQVYDYISGYHYQAEDGEKRFQPGKCALFSNFEEDGTPLVKPRTLLIDSVQLERGDLLDPDFREAAKEEIERFKKEAILRGDKIASEITRHNDVSDAALLREAMNTVGKKGQLGEGIRCVVSVGMLSEGWDANNVTHILGLRAFGTQLLCEQVIGRALRRRSYQIDKDTGLLDVEYADALGIPFDFSARPEVTPVAEPKELTWIKAMSPERDSLAITFPRVTGYRTILAPERLAAAFTDDSRLLLTPEMTGATSTENAGIIGESADLNLDNLAEVRDKTVLMYLTRYMLENWFRDGDGQPKLYLYGQLKKIAWEWMQGYLKCFNGAKPGSLLIRAFADLACERIFHAINRYNLNAVEDNRRLVQALLDPFTPQGTTTGVNFSTAKTDLWTTDARKCHINYVVTDSSWEADFCRILEKKDKPVLAYVKNHNLGFEVPYRFAGENRHYRPDFIVRIDAGQGEPINLVVEIKGLRDEEDKQKKLAMETLWLPGVNNNGDFGHWDFLELKEKHNLETDFDAAVARLRKGQAAQDGKHGQIGACQKD